MQLTQTPYNRLVPYEAPERSGEFCSFFEDDSVESSHRGEQEAFCAEDVSISATRGDCDVGAGCFCRSCDYGCVGLFLEESQLRSVIFDKQLIALCCCFL